MNNFIYILFVLLLATACKNKYKKNKSYTITGRLMSNCDTPHGASTKLFLKQKTSNLTNSGGVIKDFSCDENGYFSVNYIPDNGSKIEIGYYGAAGLMSEVPVNQNIDIGNVYLNATTNIIIKLDVKNPLTSNDTLEYLDYNSSNSNDVIRICGPFNSGIIDTAWNVDIMNFPLKFNKVQRISIGYGVYPYNPDATAWSRFCFSPLNIRT